MGWCPIKLYRYLWTRSCSVTEFLQGHQNDLTMTLEFYGGGHGKGIKINKSCKRHSIGGDTVIGSGLTHYHPFRGLRGWSILPVTTSVAGGGDGGSDDVEKVPLIHRFITGFYLLDIHPPTLLL